MTASPKERGPPEPPPATASAASSEGAAGAPSAATARATPAPDADAADKARLAAGFSLSAASIAQLVLDKQLADPRGGGPAEVRAALLAALHADAEAGLASAAVPTHRAAYGDNRLPVRRLTPFLEHLCDALSDPVLLALIACSIITVLFGVFVSHEPTDWIEGVAIMLAVVVVSGVGSVNNWRQEAQFASLTAIKADRKVLLVRDGHEASVSVYDVVVGDLLVLRTGEVLPCDGLLLAGNGVRCDESAMTGESLEIAKSPLGAAAAGIGGTGAFLLAGAQVTAGAGAMLVLTTGVRTSYGQIVSDLESTEAPPTPLQEKLEDMAKTIGYFGLAGGLLIFTVLLAAYLAQAVSSGDFSGAFRSILSYFVIGITIVVVAVPEGLPLAVTLALAYSMRRMIHDMVLVRELSACETMGSATTICSDKTGTLTENRMTVVRGWFFGGLFEGGLPRLSDIGGARQRDLLARAIALNSDAQVVYAAGAPGDSFTVTGNKTEGGLLHMLRKDFDVDYEDVRSLDVRPVFRENFSSARKRMTTVFAPGSGASRAAPLRTISEGSAGAGAAAGALVPDDGASGRNFTVFTKGASEAVLALCTRYCGSDGRAHALTDAMRVELEAVIESFASRGQRTLSVATRQVDAKRAPAPSNASDEVAAAAWEAAVAEGSVESGLTLLCIAAISDPVRAAVPGAVAQCRAAGIKVRMVTGDNLSTARSIATECGILRGGVTIEGRDWRELSDEQRREIAPQLDVMARAIPSDKLLLVETLKALGETVAVTGDGTNDAPALHAAHVGCAMGIAGTEVAKDAGKMIILDDNFASVVVAVVWGRSVLENIRKFLVFQLTINVVAGGLTFIMACIQAASPPGSVLSSAGFPLTAVQLLWINLLMDSFAALILATEPPDPELMAMAPQDRSRPLLTATMTKYIVVHAAFQLALLLWLSLSAAGCALFLLDPAVAQGSRAHYTNIFNVFVWLQLFNLLNCRRIHDQWDVLRGLHRSTTGLAVLALIAVLQVVLVQAGSNAFQTSPLSAAQWGVDLALGLLSIPIGWLCRLLPWRSDDDSKFGGGRGPAYSRGARVESRASGAAIEPLLDRSWALAPRRSPRTGPCTPRAASSRRDEELLQIAPQAAARPPPI